MAAPRRSMIPHATMHTASDESDDPAPAARALLSADPDADPPEPAQVEWLDRSGGAHAADRGWIVPRLQEAAALAGPPVQRIGVTVLNDQQMATLHLKHFGAAETTDVISFLLSEHDEPIDADLAVCVDVAARRTRGAAHHPLEQELLLYCLHGLLHCCGHDDTTPDAFEAMHAREDEILEAIGVGGTFRGDRPGHAGDRSNDERDRGPAST